jgi:hypothetical protein
VPDRLAHVAGMHAVWVGLGLTADKELWQVLSCDAALALCLLQEPVSCDVSATTISSSSHASDVSCGSGAVQHLLPG